MKIKAVVFDYGKVISFPNDETLMKNLGALAGLPAEEMKDLIWKYRDDYDRGTINGEEYYRIMLESRGIQPAGETLKEMLRLDLDSWKNINPSTAHLMEEVKASGVKLGILSNMPPDFLAFARANFPLFRLPDAAVFSCEAGFIKPEQSIYEVLLAALGEGPEETVFFDDSPPNVQKAKDMGIQAFLWENPEKARQELRDLGFPV